MHVTGMTIGGIPPFTKTVEFKFDERVNLFIGPNGTGKSTVLRMLQARTTLDGRFDFQLSDDWQQLSGTQRMGPGTRARSGEGGSRSDLTLKERSDMAPWLYIPAVRLSLPISNDPVTMHRLQSDIPVILRDDDGEEFPADRPIETTHNLLSQYYFDGSIVPKYCKAVTDLFRMRKAGSVDIERLVSAKNLAYECSQSICSDILSSDDSPSDYVYDQNVGHGIVITNILDDMGVTLAGGKNDPIFAGDLSAGTQATLLWIWYIAIEMAHFYWNGRSSSKRPAILLIDEIENHLHPTWQRRIIPALLEHFPGLQIFATTHSPFVVAGLRAGQVHLLNRDANGAITASTNDRDIIGWTADQILRTFMEVDEPTDQLTVDRSKRLRELYGKSSLTPEEESELNDLRASVSEDFPQNPVDPQLYAQRERYADMMQRFLRSRLSDSSSSLDDGPA